VKKPKKVVRKFVFDEEGLILLAKRLKELRDEKGFTQEALAYESDITLSQIARIETVKANPTVSTIFKIARTLNVPVSTLFDFKLSNKTK
jgi:transcriptional regulator with XRE-family HTH domain